MGDTAADAGGRGGYRGRLVAPASAAAELGVVRGRVASQATRVHLEGVTIGDVTRRDAVELAAAGAMLAVVATAAEAAADKIEVTGGYDQDVGDPTTRRPVTEWDVAALRGPTSREQVRRYLLSLPDDFLVKTSRHVQYRLAADGSAWDFVASASVQRVPPPARAKAPEVTALPNVDPDHAAAYARGWHPLGPPKVTEDPCPVCTGSGVCGHCLGGGRA